MALEIDANDYDRCIIILFGQTLFRPGTGVYLGVHDEYVWPR